MVTCTGHIGIHEGADGRTDGRTTYVCTYGGSVAQCGPVVRALVLRSADPGFKTRSDHSLNLILVVPGSASQLHL